MGKKKAGFMSPKAIANRWKSKGLQKLRWYCQMCQKQCRDENGFKCHTTSESHLRQMKIYSGNAGKIIANYSAAFEAAFTSLLSRRFNNTRVKANQVYNEYIQDKEHIHMNATRWVSLAGFVKYLGRTGKAEVDETEKGWYVKWIDRDPRALARQEKLLAMEKHDRNEEDRQRRLLQKLIDESNPDEVEESKFTGLQRTEGDKVKVALAKKQRPALAAFGGSDKGKAESKGNDKKRTRDVFAAAGSGSGSGSGAAKPGREEDERPHKKRRSALDDIMAENERQKERHRAVYGDQGGRRGGDAGAGSREDKGGDTKPEKKKKKVRKSYWLTPGIVVKIMNKSLADGNLYKQKAVVKKVVDKYGAVLKLLDGDVKVQIDQDELETVIPREGGRVYVVNGIHRGKTGTVRSIDVDKFCTTVKLESGEKVSIEYEDVCKLAKR